MDNIQSALLISHCCGGPGPGYLCWESDSSLPHLQTAHLHRWVAAAMPFKDADSKPTICALDLATIHNSSVLQCAEHLEHHIVSHSRGPLPLLLLLPSAETYGAPRMSYTFCRFEDAHTARLAYDQTITGLGLSKPTNYKPGAYPLNNPEVEAKLQQFLNANPDMAAAAAAVVTSGIGSASANVAAAAAAAAENAKRQQAISEQQAQDAAAASAAAGLIEIFISCAAAAAAAAATPAPAARDGAHAAGFAAPAAAPSPTSAAGTSIGITSDPFAHAAAVATAAAQEQLAAGNCYTNLADYHSSRTCSEPCCSDGPHASAGYDLPASSSSSGSSSAGKLTLQQLLQQLASNASLLSGGSVLNSAQPAADDRARVSEPATGLRPVSASPASGGAFHAYGSAAAGSASHKGDLRSRFADAGLLPEAPPLRLSSEDQPWAQQQHAAWAQQQQQQQQQHVAWANQQQEQQQHAAWVQQQQQEQQLQQLACIQTLLGLSAAGPDNNPSQPSPAAPAAAPASAAAPAQARTAAAALAAAAKEATALEILAAWAAVQAEAMGMETASDDAPTAYAAAPDSAAAHV
jgi:hypothetical protein